MDENIHQTLLFLLFIFPAIITSKNSCPTSTCGSIFVPIKYPFKLQSDHPPKSCQDYINLRCNDQGPATINLPSSGDFYVTDINYHTRKIALSDPRNCLPGKLMANFSLYPLQAFGYVNYTYYTCPRKMIIYPLNVIECLSNSTDATIATSAFSTGFMEEVFSCKAIVSSMIPVFSTSEYDCLGISDCLQLTWNVSGCKDCEDYGAGKSGDSKSKWTKFFGSTLFMPLAVVLITFFGIACLLRLIKRMVGRANTTNASTPNNAATDGSSTEISATSTTVALPRTTGDTSNTNGVEDSKVKIYAEIVVLGDMQSPSLTSGVTCSICLEEFQGKDRVRFLPQCGHYFHVECIDLWLQKNTTCPVCRTSLYNLKE